MDQISFNFTKVEFEYFEQDAKGVMKSAGKNLRPEGDQGQLSRAS